MIQQTVRETLPEGFQRSEFLLEHGALDLIFDRRDMRERLARAAAHAHARSQPPCPQLPSLRRRTAGMRSLADWLEQQQKSHPSAIDLDLERGCARWRGAGAAARRAIRVITVGGTNGKGSTVACLDAMSARRRPAHAGAFTSPHLARYNERICIDGDEASDDAR